MNVLPCSGRSPRLSLAGLDAPISDPTRRRHVERQLADGDLRFPGNRRARRGPRGRVGRLRHPGQEQRGQRMS